MIRDWLEAAAQERPAAPALSSVGSGETLDFRRLRDRVAAEAVAFSVGEWVPMSPRRTAEDVCRFLAVLWAGAVPQLGSRLEASECEDGTLLRLYSSGSTGDPKAIDLSEAQVRASVEASASRLRQAADDSWACVLPLTHVGGISILFRCLHGQSETVLMEGSFDALGCSRLLQEGRVSQISLVPNQLQRMLPFLERFGVSQRVRLLLVGGASTPADLVENSRRLGLPLARTWGMSECASQVATEEPGSFSEWLRPLPGVRVSNDEATGRLQIEGAIAPGGRYLSNDVGEVTEWGVRVGGRVDDICVSGGENLSMNRLQRALLSHPEIQEAAVVKRPCAEWGERPHAVLVALRRPVDEAVLRAYLMEGGLRKRELPDSIEWRLELPRTELGKVRRGAL